MTKKTLVFTVIILFGLASLSLGAPQPVRRNFRARMVQPGWGLLKMLEARQQELGVTNDQLQKIQNLVNAYEEKMIDLKSQMSKYRLEMRNLFWVRENVNLNQLRKALDEAAKFRQEMIIQRIQLRQEINSILTPDQRNALQKMWQEFGGRRDAFLRQGRAQRQPWGRRGRALIPRRGISRW